MRRRDFITVLGGAATVWPFAVRAQQSERVRRVGVLVPLDQAETEAQARIGVFRQALQELGWTAGRNVQIDVRLSGQASETRKHVAELVELAPDVILASGTAAVGPVLQATRSVPIVFTLTPDPVGAGFVDSLARPGGNATGFITFEFGISGKWLELLKQIAPAITRIAVIRDPALSTAVGQFGAIQSVAPSLGVEVTPINVRDTSGDIERDLAAFARAPNSGLIVTGSASATAHRGLIIKLAARHKLPAVYYTRFFVTDGGLIAYGPDFLDQFRRAAGYVDRILKGENPADLPVQTPTRYELAINLKTAKALGLTVPLTLLARADHVVDDS